MEITRRSDVLTSTSDRFHTPMEVEQSHLPEETGWRGRLGHLKSGLVTRVSGIKPMALERVSSMHDGVRGGMRRIDSQMRSSPGKWAGIAAGAGFVLGMGGRIMRSRSSTRKLPNILVIEGC